MTGPAKSQIPQILRLLKLYKVSSFITGTFLILLMITWGIRRLPFFGYDLWLGGPNGLLTFEQHGVDGLGLPDVGLNLTVVILIVHGWLYVLYLFADFRLWTLMRWPFSRFLFIAAGGVIPLLSFYTESRYAKLAHSEIEKVERD